MLYVSRGQLPGLLTRDSHGKRYTDPSCHTLPYSTHTSRRPRLRSTASYTQPGDTLRHMGSPHTCEGVPTNTHRYYLHIPASVGTQGHPCQVTQTLAHPGTMSYPFLQQHPTFAHVPEVQQSSGGAHKEVHTYGTDTNLHTH